MVDAALKVVLGMTLSYVASFAGLFFAWYYYRKRHRGRDQDGREGR